ncbi:MAG TPA: GNAT family N-acetyltransferase [Gammaproteobacteria bacterium]|nr:GNAT family N-acetyltransferase [Gammaproteobacteria bacterium]
MVGVQGYVLRLAVEADAKALAQVHIKSWREIYRDVFPVHVLEKLDVAMHAEHWRSVIATVPANIVVCESDRVVIGFLSLGTSNDYDSCGTAGEITTIYLDPQHWRRGYGAALMSWALSQAENRGWQRINLWSLQENHRARAFYESVGFRFDGATKLGCLSERFSDTAELYVTLIRFSRQLVT